MGSEIIINFLRFFLLLALQIFVMDQVHFLGFIDPLVYVLFILWFPFVHSRWVFMISCFLLGLALDAVHDTGGAHAAAALTLAFLRPVILKIVYGESYLMRNFRLRESAIDKLIIYFAIAILVHHLLFFSLMVFNVSRFLLILKYTGGVGVATFIVSLLLHLIFTRRRPS